MIADPELEVLADAKDEHQRQWLSALVERTKTLMLLDNELMGGKACENPERAHRILEVWQQIDRSFDAIRCQHREWFEQNKDFRDSRLDAKMRAQTNLDELLPRIQRCLDGTAITYSREEVRRELGLPV